MVAEPRSFTVLGAATALRRQLGPTAWAVLEELVARSDGPAARCAAATSVRSLAAELGVSKDTVARALARLCEAGIVTAAQPRASSGTFTAGSYLIAVPACLTLSDLAPVVPEPRPRPLASRALIAQRSLFDRDPATP